ncbi:hypothetical protein LSAT2_012007 [Lamellibrachia satsuma]|nr:hypothetical protein LSAT2_012007 [Lamellibrachia satsuma]
MKLNIAIRGRTESSMKLNITILLLAATLLARSCSGGRQRDRPSSGTHRFRFCVEQCDTTFNMCIRTCPERNIDKCRQNQDRCKKRCKKLFKIRRAKERTPI